MIIWINGSFGVGKTSVAEELNKRDNESIIYDPEKIGFFLQSTLIGKENDFQDYKLWRTINYEMLKLFCCKFEKIIVPMTITNRKYYDEIVGRLKEDGVTVKHFILTASKEAIIKRLDNRGNSTDWAYRQIDRCIKAFCSEDIKGIKIDTDSKSIGEVTESIRHFIQ